jgi:hypothetical protein
MVSKLAIGIMVLLLLYAVLHLVKYIKYMKPAAQSTKPCYEIKPEKGTEMSIRDSGYILNRIGYFIGQESKNGICTADIKIDLRYTSTTSIYKAICALEHDGAKVKEGYVNPTTMIISVDWKEVKSFTVG